MKSTHAGQLERWVGAQGIENVSAAMRGWYGPPIAVAGVPGTVYATSDGDFVGECRAGYEATAEDYLWEIVARARRAVRKVSKRHGMLQTGGFASLADLIAEGSGGKRQVLTFTSKNATAGAVGGVSSWWRDGTGSPAAGSAGAAAPGGTVYTSASTGAIAFVNAPSGDKTFLGRTMMGFGQPANPISTGLLHDRLFAVAKTMSSTATEAVTGVPTRYTSTTPTDPDYAAGNFLYVEATGTESGAHNWTVCQYTDQSGNTGSSFPSFAGVNGQASGRQDFAVQSNWFVPLAAGDNGILALTQMQCDASITGGADFALCHPLAWMPSPIQGFLAVADGITSAFNLVRVFDNACLSMFMLATAPATVPMSGTIELISG